MIVLTKLSDKAKKKEKKNDDLDRHIWHNLYINFTIFKFSYIRIYKFFFEIFRNF